MTDFEIFVFKQVAPKVVLTTLPLSIGTVYSTNSPVESLFNPLEVIGGSGSGCQPQEGQGA